MYIRKMVDRNKEDSVPPTADLSSMIAPNEDVSDGGRST